MSFRSGPTLQAFKSCQNVIRTAGLYIIHAVLLNAGAALYIDGKAETMEEGIKLAAELIDSGKAMETFEKLIAVSNS